MIAYCWNFDVSPCLHPHLSLFAMVSGDFHSRDNGWVDIIILTFIIRTCMPKRPLNGIPSPIFFFGSIRSPRSIKECQVVNFPKVYSASCSFSTHPKPKISPRSTPHRLLPNSLPYECRRATTALLAPFNSQATGVRRSIQEDPLHSEHAPSWTSLISRSHIFLKSISFPLVSFPRESS